MSNNKLERCPFCGKRDSVVLVENKDYDQYYVLCDPDREPSGCGAETAVFITAKDAVEAWNRRAPHN